MSVKELCIYAAGTALTAALAYGLQYSMLTRKEYEAILAQEVLDAAVVEAVLTAIATKTAGRENLPHTIPLKK